MRDAFIARLTEIVEADPNVMLITGDLGFGVLTDFAERFPDNFVNAGVAEQNMTGLAAGLALSGRVVFTYSIANFPTLRCLEQIRNDAAHPGADVKVVAVGGGFSYGPLGASHHATEDLAILRALPGMTVVAPGCCWEVDEATKLIATTPGTFYLRLDKSAAAPSQRPDEVFEIGRGRLLEEGADVVLITTGGILGEVLEAANLLRADGIAPTVVSMHTVKPLDVELLDRVCRDAPAVLTIEEHIVDGGLGGAVAEACLERGSAPRRFRRLGLVDDYVTDVGSQQYLRQKHGLDAAAIATSARDLMADAAVENV